MRHLIAEQLQLHLPEQTDFLIGLSGGVDSVVLLDLFRQLPQIKLRAVHVYHGLSPNAENWALFCEQLCKRWDIPFFLQKVQVETTGSVEANARAARYQAVSEIIQPNEVFVTAHHLDDQAETFLLALKRGSGIKGLSAMPVLGEQAGFQVFRPLLSIEKSALITYAEQNKLAWIHDESNADNRFERNFLRNAILPVLNQRFPQFNRMVARSASLCAEQQALIEELLGEELARRTDSAHCLDIRGFEQFSALKQQQLVRLWLAKCALQMPSQAQLQAVISEVIFAKAGQNPEVVLGEKIVRRFQEKLVITQPLPAINDFVAELPAVEQGEFSLELPSGLGRIVRTKSEIIYHTGSGRLTHQIPLPLTQAPLTLKLRQGGKVSVYGKPLCEEMKKLYQQHHVPVWERDRTPLIFFQNQLVFLLKM